MLNQCFYCGASTRPAARFCPRCGRPLSPPPYPPQIYVAAGPPPLPLPPPALPAWVRLSQLGLPVGAAIILVATLIPWVHVTTLSPLPNFNEDVNFVYQIVSLSGPLTLLSATLLAAAYGGWYLLSARWRASHLVRYVSLITVNLILALVVFLSFRAFNDINSSVALGQQIIEQVMRGLGWLAALAGWGSLSPIELKKYVQIAPGPGPYVCLAGAIVAAGANPWLWLRR